MNWYNGNISQAVKLSQQKNSIFVVYVEGDDELSVRMGKFINEDPRIKKHLESEHFVAIRIETGSEPYMQFAQIYQLVPSPSMFFIGKNGAPLEIATGIIESADDLVKKIEKVLEVSEKSPKVGTSSANLISEEQVSNSSPIVTETTTPGNNSTTDNIVSEDSSIDHAAQLEKARKIIETKRKEKEAEEEKLHREKEIERRKLGKNIQSFKEKQKEEEFQKLKEERIRDRLEEQVARQRILEKIASDKAERAQRFSTQSTSAVNSVETSKSHQNLIPKPAPSNSDTSRIQFRTPDGQIHTHTFGVKDEFQIIRNYVANTILDGKNNFQLATTFPKREFTMSDDSQTISDLGLYPSAQILIFCDVKNSNKPSTVARQSGQILSMFNSLFMTLCSPIFAIFGYLRNLITRDNNTNNSTPHQPQQEQTFGGVTNTIKGFFTGNKSGGVGAQKRANEDQSSPNDDAKKRNINRLISGGIVNDGASTSVDTKSGSGSAYRRTNVHRLRDLNDSDDDNATWNGNSTQQQ